MKFNIKEWQDKHIIKEDRQALTKRFAEMLTPLFRFMKSLDVELPRQAKNNPNMKKDLVKLNKLKIRYF